MRTTNGQTVFASALFAILLGVSPLAAAHEPPSGLLAHFTFDGTLADATANGLAGQAIGKEDEPVKAQFAEGKFGQALRLSGKSAVLVPLDLHFEQYPEVTVTGWVYLQNREARGVLIGTGAGDGPQLRVNGESLYGLHPGGRAVANKVLREGRWHFFAGTWDYRSGTMRLNWRARSKQEPFKTENLDPPGQDIFIGALNDRLGRAAKGLLIDDVRVYGRMLSADELVGLRLGPPGESAIVRKKPGRSKFDSEETGVMPMPYADSAEAPTERWQDDPLATPGADADDTDTVISDLPTASEPAPAAMSRPNEPGIDEFDADNYTPPRGDPQHIVLIDGAGGSGRTRYTLIATDAVEKADGTFFGIQATINDNDLIEGRSASGVVGTAADAYYVFGDVQEITLEDSAAAEVYIDGALIAEFTVDETGSEPVTIRQPLEKEAESTQPESVPDRLSEFVDTTHQYLNENIRAEGCQSIFELAEKVAAELADASTDVGCTVTANATRLADPFAPAVQPIDVRSCLEDTGKIQEFSTKAASKWNELVARNGWATIGPRTFEIGDIKTGTIAGLGDRKWITMDYLAANAVKVELEKTGGRNETKVLICKQDQRGNIELLDEIRFNREGTRNAPQKWKQTYQEMRNRQLIIMLDGTNKPLPAPHFEYRMETMPSITTR